jgi:hypothetical protein
MAIPVIVPKDLILRMKDSDTSVTITCKNEEHYLECLKRYKRKKFELVEGVPDPSREVTKMPDGVIHEERGIYK